MGGHPRALTGKRIELAQSLYNEKTRAKKLGEK